MSTLASLNLVLGAQTGEFDKATDKVTGRLNRLGSDVDRFKKKTEANGGVFGGFGKSLRNMAMEERQNGGRQIQQLLMGGSFGMTGMLTEVLAHDAEAMSKAAKEAFKSGGGMGDIAEEMMGNLPVIGGAWKAGREIKRGAQDFWAVWRKEHGASAEEAFESLSEETQAEFQKTWNDFQKSQTDAISHRREGMVNRDMGTALLGLRGGNRIEQERKNYNTEIKEATKKANEELHELADKLNNDPEFAAMPQWQKKNIYRMAVSSHQSDLESLTKQKQAEYKAALEEQSWNRGNMLDQGSQKNEALKGSILASGLAAGGHEFMAQMETVNNNYKAQLHAVDDWEAANKRAYPEAASQIHKVAEETRHLLANQKHLAEIAPLEIALRQYKEMEKYSRADLNSATGNSFAKQMHDLKEMGATEKQMAEARRQMQVAADIGLARGVKESTRTPLEKLKHDMQELNRLKEEDLISKDEYERRKGDLGDEARKSLGIYGDPQRTNAMQMRHGFTVNAEPQFADPLSKLLGVQTNTLKESQRQRIALEKLVNNNATVLSLDDLPGN